MLAALENSSRLELALTGVGCFLLYQLYLYLTVGAARRKLIEQHGCKPVPVYPHSGPFGLTVALGTAKREKARTVLQGIQERFQNHGNTFSMELMGQKIVSTCDPENIKTALSLKFSDFELGPRRKNAFVPLFGEGIFTTDGSHWEHSRAMLRPSFIRAQVADLGTFETHVNQVIRAVPTDGSTVDLGDLFFDLTLDSSTEFLFGESANTLAARAANFQGENFSDSFTYCTAAMAGRLRMGLTRGLPDKKYDRAKKFVHDFVDRYVEKVLEHHRAGSPPSEKHANRYVFLYELVKQTQDPIVLRSEALNILLAGRDTTASLLTNLWNTLSKRPDVWSKLQAEVDQLNGKTPSFEEIKNMKYLRYCLNEALRLYPVVPSNGRIAVRDTILPRGGGPDGNSPVLVKKGTSVGYSTYTMHRREDLYGPDAAEFNPERWITRRPGWEYLPFNGGPRICLGQQFALTEASYTTIRLMQHFRTIESRDPNPWEELLTATCTNRHGAKVALGK